MASHTSSIINACSAFKILFTRSTCQTYIKCVCFVFVFYFVLSVSALIIAQKVIQNIQF